MSPHDREARANGLLWFAPLGCHTSAGCPQSRPVDADASAAEPASVRTGWALTAALQRKCGSQGEQTREARLRGLLDYGETRARPEMRLTVRFILWKMEVLNVYEKTAIYHSIGPLGVMLAENERTSRQ